MCEDQPCPSMYLYLAVYPWLFAHLGGNVLVFSYYAYALMIRAYSYDN